MQQLTDRPPFVKFELRSMEDRTATAEAGHYVAKDVPFAIVTPAGSKDRYENVADNWFAMLREEVKAKRFPEQWLEYYTQSYQAWIRNEEPPVNGTSIKTWPAIGPSQVKNLLGLSVRTVEDLAAANEETIMRIGMGGRALVQKAQAWLASANDTGKVAEKLAQQSARLDQLEKENEALRSRVAVLRANAKAPPEPEPAPTSFSPSELLED